MKPTGILRVSLILATAILSAAQAKPNAKPSTLPTYTAVALPAYWNGTSAYNTGYGHAISSSVAAGAYDASDGFRHAALFTLDGNSYQDLGVPAGSTDSVALAVNDLGQAAGRAYDTYTEHAVLFQNGTITSIPNLPFFGDTNVASWALGINHAGQVVGGQSISGSSDVRGFMYWNGALTDLGPGYPVAINGQGKIVGSMLVNGQRRAARIISNSFHDLGVLPGDTSSEATAINDFNAIVGISVGAGCGSVRSFIYQNKMKALPSLPNDTATFAYAINKAATIVGYGAEDYCNGYSHGLIWINGQVYDLNSLVPSGTPRIYAAYGINDAGEIITDTMLLIPTVSGR